MIDQDISLCFKNVCFQYQKSHPIVHNLCFAVKKGSRIAILGESGTGKSTLLRLIAGLESISDGEIFVNNKLVSSAHIHLPPSQRCVGMVFQEWGVFPHLNIFDNVAFGLSKRGKILSEKKRVMHLLNIFEISELATRFPQTLSGGQLQRVACARSLAQSPEVLLLDEAFSCLDSKMRERVRKQVVSALIQEKTTSILVTHDLSEAKSFADHIFIMNEGVLKKINSHYWIC